MTSITQKFNHTYDPANRLTSVNGQAVQWDDNGNMLADGQAVYTYNTANKLVGVTKGTSIIVYAYSGLGDRLKQIADGVTTDYTLDINAGLTQVLDDGTNKYLYGNQRIAQIAPTQTGYFLPDALGSMRQMTDPSADLTLARTYDPYGNVVSSSGAGETVYGYTGEMQNDNNKLVNLRARQLSTVTGRFINKDTWTGDYDKPATLNKWNYVRSNPVIYIDPTGHYDRQAVIDFAKKFDRNNVLPTTFLDGNKEEQLIYEFTDVNLLCTVFASNALWNGGVKDLREDPIKNNKDDYPDLNYWSKNALILDKNHPDWQYHPGVDNNKLYITNGENSPWSQVNALYRFLRSYYANTTGIEVLYSSNVSWYYGDDAWGNKAIVSDDWEQKINNARMSRSIQPGDLVFYGNGGRDWNHVAIVLGWGDQTSNLAYEENGVIKPYPSDLTDTDSYKYFHNNCLYRSPKPRVLEKSGYVIYQRNLGRSIDNTSTKANEILVMHLQ